MAAVQAAPAPPASASITADYYKRQANRANEERDDAFDERDAAFVERDMAVDERDMALEEVERLEALVAELKQEMKERKFSTLPSHCLRDRRLMIWRIQTRGSTAASSPRRR